MAIAYDSANSSEAYRVASHSLTIGSGSNRAVFAAVATQGAAGNGTPTFNSTSMSLIASVSCTSYTTTGLRVFGLLEASLPSAGTYTVAHTNTVGWRVILGSVAFSGVDQTSLPSNYTTDSDGSYSQTATFTNSVTVGESDAWVVDFSNIMIVSASIAPGSGQTERYDQTQASANLTSNASTKATPGTGSQSMSETPGTTHDGYNHIVLDLEAYAAAVFKAYPGLLYGGL